MEELQIVFFFIIINFNKWSMYSLIWDRSWHAPNKRIHHHKLGSVGSSVWVGTGDLRALPSQRRQSCHLRSPAWVLLLMQKKVDWMQIRLFEMKLLSHSSFLPHPTVLLTSSKFGVKLIVPSLQGLHQTMLLLSQPSKTSTPRLGKGSEEPFFYFEETKQSSSPFLLVFFVKWNLTLLLPLFTCIAK